MRFASAVAAAGLIASSAAQNATAAWPSDVYVTEVVTAFTTYCPYATELTHGGSTYTVSEATTLTITNCPCTVTKPVSSAVVTSCSGASCSSAPVVPISASSAPAPPAPYSSAAVSSPSVPVAPVPYSSASSPAAPTVAPYPTAGNATVPIPAPVGSGSAVSSGVPTGSATASATIAPYTGAANKAYSAAGAGFLALFGLVVAL